VTGVTSDDAPGATRRDLTETEGPRAHTSRELAAGPARGSVYGRRVLRIGLTGGIGSGKSTVAALLAGRGAQVVDADRIAREVLEPGTPGLAAVVSEFGAGVVGPDGALDRAALASIVFGDPAARARLDGIVHPRVRARAAEAVAAAPADAVVVQDVPLLVETGQAGSFDLVLVVEADPDTRVARLVGRGLSADDARARMASQATDEQRRAVADVVLRNDGDRAALAAAVDRFWDERVAPTLG
jgi:dephospho-CoA kinase